MRHRVAIDSLFLRVAYACTDSILLLLLRIIFSLFTSQYSFVFCESAFSVIFKDCTKRSLIADHLRL
jgi:hypothetical protein